MIVIFIIIQVMVGPTDIFLSLVLTNDCCLFIAQLLSTCMGNYLCLMMITVSLASWIGKQLRVAISQLLSKSDLLEFV